MTDMKLLYFEGCPNAEKVRAHLQQLHVAFDEVRQDTLPKDHPLRAYSSPTILKDGAVVSGAKIDAQNGGCSLDIPSLEYLKKKFREIDNA